MNKQWISRLDGRRWSLNKIESEILKSRGIMNLDRFLYPIEEDMIQFEKLKNIKEGAICVLEGIKKKKSFFVYFDTDL